MAKNSELSTHLKFTNFVLRNNFKVSSGIIEPNEIWREHSSIHISREYVTGNMKTDAAESSVMNMRLVLIFSKKYGIWGQKLESGVLVLRPPWNWLVRMKSVTQENIFALKDSGKRGSNFWRIRWICELLSDVRTNVQMDTKHVIKSHLVNARII